MVMMMVMVMVAACDGAAVDEQCLIVLSKMVGFHAGAKCAFAVVASASMNLLCVLPNVALVIVAVQTNMYMQLLCSAILQSSASVVLGLFCILCCAHARALGLFLYHTQPSAAFMMDTLKLYACHVLASMYSESRTP
jgi:hypothetical protein